MKRVIWPAAVPLLGGSGWMGSPDSFCDISAACTRCASASRQRVRRMQARANTLRTTAPGARGGGAQRTHAMRGARYATEAWRRSRRLARAPHSAAGGLRPHAQQRRKLAARERCAAAGVVARRRRTHAGVGETAARALAPVALLTSATQCEWTFTNAHPECTQCSQQQNAFQRARRHACAPHHSQATAPVLQHLQRGADARARASACLSLACSRRWRWRRWRRRSSSSSSAAGLRGCAQPR
jgi:hypothetical protein